MVSDSLAKFHVDTNLDQKKNDHGKKRLSQKSLITTQLFNLCFKVSGFIVTNFLVSLNWHNLFYNYRVFD